MNIGGIEKLSLVDYPGEVACTIFTQGCNFKCPFCHNSDLIEVNAPPGISEEDTINYLKRRRSVIDAVVVSGGEPLIQKDIKGFIKRIKELGFKVKLDTNGSNYILLKELIDEKLIDYVAIDIKADKDNYQIVTGLEKYNFKHVERVIKLLNSSFIDYEFRTTVVKEFHDLKILESICEIIGDKSKYYLQNFVDSERVLKKGLHGFDEKELKNIEKELNKKFPNVKVRGL